MGGGGEGTCDGVVFESVCASVGEDSEREGEEGGRGGGGG